MDVILDLSCFHGASKATCSILNVISTAASVTVVHEWAIGKALSLKSQTSISTEVMKLITFIHNSVFERKKKLHVSAKDGLIL